MTHSLLEDNMSVRDANGAGGTAAAIDNLAVTDLSASLTVLSSTFVNNAAQGARAGSGSGRKGYSAATRPCGTEWTAADRCEGTLTIVKRGTVDVYDAHKRRTIREHAGHRYVATVAGGRG